MTPTVHYDHDVTLKIKIEVTSQSGSVTISGVTEPILSQRVVDQVIRLREGEASILGGIQDKQDAVSWTGIPGLSSIPILKYLFGSKDHTISDDELVFLVVPHIVRTQTLDRTNLRPIDTGAGTAVELRRIAVPTTPDGSPSPASPSPAPSGPTPDHAPAPAARPTVGVLPGQSAMAAAPAALAQMSASADVNGQTAAAAVTNPAPVPPGPAEPAASSAKPPNAGAAADASAINVLFSPPGGPISVGKSFEVPVVLTGGKDVDSVPLQVQYDPAVLALVNVSSGDLLGKDNQAVALVHRDDGPGSITINAARPPGVAGISGAGVVCVLTFQPKVAGNTALTLTKAAAMNSNQQFTQAKGSQVTIAVH
jgi:general secretion pathway protein D